jgi:phosphatidylethanolamine-binding protein (PEBP) family uncharacterized protein
MVYCTNLAVDSFHSILAPPPGHGTHRYQFCVTALPVETLPIDENTSPAVCHFNMYVFD